MGDMTEHFDWDDAFVSSRYPYLINEARKRATDSDKAMLYITFEFLEIVRRHYNVPLRSLSAFRTVPIVKRLKADGFNAKLTSLHLKGIAIDFTTWYDKDKDELARMYSFIKNHMKHIYGELILYKTDNKPDRIHFALKAHKQPQFYKVKEE